MTCRRPSESLMDEVDSGVDDPHDHTGATMLGRAGARDVNAALRHGEVQIAAENSETPPSASPRQFLERLELTDLNLASGPVAGDRPRSEPGLVNSERFPSNWIKTVTVGTRTRPPPREWKAESSANRRRAALRCLVRNSRRDQAFPCVPPVNDVASWCWTGRPLDFHSNTTSRQRKSFGCVGSLVSRADP